MQRVNLVDRNRKIDSTTGLSLGCADCEGHVLLRLRKNSCFVSGHGFTVCWKTVLYQVTTLSRAVKV